MTDPEQMRSAMSAYVKAVHQAYLDAAASLPPGDRARLPLAGVDEFTVLAVGSRYLHVLATTDPLPEPEGQEVSVQDALGNMRWQLRFFDPIVAPGLGLIDETDAPAPLQVRETLGVRSVMYHLSVPPGSGLTPHHALHAGTGLAHAHAAADRDFATLASLVPERGPVIHEMHAAHVNGLARAHLLLARDIAGANSIEAHEDDFEQVRRQTLAALRDAQR
jgi:hypothetical protein